MSVPETGESFDLDRPGAVAAWNRALNRRYAMQNLRDHPNPMVRFVEARRRARIASLVTPFDRALDLGAEDGTLAGAWRGKGRFLLLLDVDASVLQGAPRERRVAADASRLPVAARSFDLVVCSALLEHVLDPARTVAECVRVLQPGGRLVAYVPWDRAVVRLKRWARRAGLQLGKLHDGGAPGHLRIFDRGTLRQLFAPFARSLRIRLDPLSLGYYVEATVPS